MVRPRFDLRKHGGLPMVAATSFTFLGQSYQKGDDFPVDTLDARKVQTMHGAGRINFVNNPAQAERDRLAARRADLMKPASEFPEFAPVTTKASGGGYYEISAPWLDEPVKAHGKAKAKKAAGDLFTAGEPDNHGVTLMAGENGWYSLTRDGSDTELKVQGEEAARAAAAKLRAGEMIDGQPIEWGPLAEGDRAIVGEDAGEPLAGKTVVIENIDGEDAIVATDPDEDDNVLTGTVPLATLTRAPVAEVEQEPPAGETKPGETPAPALPEGGGPQPGTASPTDGTDKETEQ